MKMLMVATAAILFTLAAFAGEKGMGSQKVDFAEVDSDRNGYVDQVEASAAGFGEMTFKQMDSNRDGKVSKEEFKSGHTKGEQEQEEQY